MRTSSEHAFLTRFGFLQLIQSLQEMQEMQFLQVLQVLQVLQDLQEMLIRYLSLKPNQRGK